MARRRPTLAPESERPVPPARGGRWWLAVAALVTLTAVAYWGAGRLQFVPLDDQGYVYENPQVKAGLTLDGVRWAATAIDQANWHPVTWLSHMLDVELFGLDAGAHHVTSVVFHTLNTLLLFFLLWKTTGATGRSAAVAALFAVHPLHVESVAWVAERKDVLSTFFWLLTMVAYVGYTRAPKAWRYGLVAALFALGLMSKPMLVTLPFTLLLLDVWPLERLHLGGSQAGADRADRPTTVSSSAVALVREKLPLFVLAACSSAITVVAQSRGGAVRTLDVVPFGVRVANALTAYVGYLLKAAWPAHLAVFYPLDRSVRAWQAMGAFALLAAITWLVVRARRRQPYLIAGWFWYLGTLVPVIGLVQVGSQAMADRYTYVPLIGIFVMAVWGAADALRRWKVGRVALPALTAVVVIACAAATRAQVAYWQDAWTLWTHALAVTGDNEAAHVGVGAMLGMQGRYEDAAAHFREALRISPRSAGAERGLGFAQLNLGRFTEAEEHLSLAVRDRPAFPDAHNDLGLALAALGRPGDAIPHYVEALRLAPGRADTRRNLGRALMMFGRADEAIAQYREAIRLAPDVPGAHADLGFALLVAGRNAEAKTRLVEALRLDPNLAEAHDALGFALAAEGRMAEALPHLADAVRLAPGLEVARVHLGMALAASGRGPEAAQEFREALRLNPNNADARRLLEKSARLSPAAAAGAAK